MAYSTFNTGIARTVRKLVNQVAHGFSVGEVLRLDATPVFVLAQADSDANSRAVGIVSEVVDADNFYLTETGYIIGLAGLTGGDMYFLSPSTPGAITNVEPTTVGQVSRPVLIADSATTGYVMFWKGDVIESGLLFSWNSVGINTSMAVNNGYIATAAINLLLPSSASVGDVVRIVGDNTTFTVTQGAGQQVNFGSSFTTSGAGGSLASTDVGASLEIICTTTDTDFYVLSSVGNFTVV